MNLLNAVFLDLKKKKKKKNYIREICLKRKVNHDFTYVAFLDLKSQKAYDSVPIFNILTKLFHLGICDKKKNKK